MSEARQPEQDSSPGGISLEGLREAYARAMGFEPAPADAQPETAPPLDAAQQQTTAEQARPGEAGASKTPPSDERSETGEAARPVQPMPEADADASCPLDPLRILEAMLFVGNRENRPLSARQAAQLLRGVEPEEIPELVRQLNSRYAANGCPYEIVSVRGGYRMTLRAEYDRLRQRFYARRRQARLSQAAVDVLSIVAYKQPITADEIAQLRGKPSRHILSQLVHRGLLRIERKGEGRPVVRYRTTERFLRLFGIESLDELPRAEDPSL